MTPKWAKDLYHAARVRAAKKGIEFSLTYSDLAELVAQADGRCLISKIPFEFDKQGHRVKRPFAPSMDRINHEVGYVLGNVRFVSVAANVAMNVWGEAALRRLAEGICGVQSGAGVWAPPNRGDGVTARRQHDGRCLYMARLRIGGKDYSFGHYKNRAEAAARIREVRAALDGGADPIDLVSQASRDKHRRFAQALPNEKLASSLETLLNL